MSAMLTREARIARADRLLAKVRALSASARPADQRRGRELAALIADEMQQLAAEILEAHPVLALHLSESGSLPRC